MHKQTADRRRAAHTLVSAFGVLGSRVLGFVRDSLLAHVLGPAADIFLAAFRVPNLVRRLAAEGSLGMAHAAVLSRMTAGGRSQTGREQSRDVLRFSRRVMVLTAMVFCLVAMFVGLGARPLMALLTPGFSPHDLDLAARYLRWCLPYLPLAAAGAVAAATLNAAGRYAASAFSPALLNIGIILVALPLVASGGTWPGSALPLPKDPALWFCMGLVFGGCLQLLFLLVRMGKVCFARTDKMDGGQNVERSVVGAAGRKEVVPEKIPAPGDVLKAMPWAVAGASSQQINMIVAYAAASFLAGGSISALYFAERLMELPLAVAGAVVATVALPDLARQTLQKTKQEFRATLGAGVLTGMFLSLPAAAGLAGAGRPCISLLFGHGAFGEEDIALTTAALQVFCLGLPAMCLNRLFSGAVTALDSASGGKSRASAASCAASALVTAACCWLWAVPFGTPGVAAAVTVGAWLQTVLLWATLQAKKAAPSVDAAGAVRGITYAAGALLLYLMLEKFFFFSTGKGLLALELCGIIGASIAGWFMIFRLFKRGEARILLITLRFSGEK